MDWTPFQSWLSRADLFVVAVVLFGAMGLAAVLGALMRGRGTKPSPAPPPPRSDGGEGYVVSAVLGLLALLLGFTFSLAVERFEARRLLVLTEANAIGTAYLRAQLLAEPDRDRMSDLLIRYTDNRLQLAKARPDRVDGFLQTNDALVTDIWAAADASYDSIKSLPFSATYLDSVNAVIDLDASRKAARAARVPAEVFAVLFIYMVTTSGVLGYALKGRGGQLAGCVLLALLTLSLMLIVDIDRPTMGGIFETQGPMEALQKSLHAQPRSVFDKWRSPGGSPPPPG